LRRSGDGDTRTEGKIFSLFEPSTEIILKGKAGKPNEFGENGQT
jgi:IS5 family transposase